MGQQHRQHEVDVVAGALTLPPGVTVRAWEAHDFTAIQRLSREEGWTTPMDRPHDALEAWRRSWPALVAVTESTVIGFCRCVSDGSVTTYVAEVLVAPPWRGQGVASALLKGCQRLCPGSRLNLLASSTSRAYYEHIGFRPFAGYRLSWAEREVL